MTALHTVFILGGDRPKGGVGGGGWQWWGGVAILLVADWGLFPDKGALNGGHFNKLHERSIKQ